MTCVVFAFVPIEIHFWMSLLVSIFPAENWWIFVYNTYNLHIVLIRIRNSKFQTEHRTTKIDFMQNAHLQMGKLRFNRTECQSKSKRKKKIEKETYKMVRWGNKNRHTQQTNDVKLAFNRTLNGIEVVTMHQGIKLLSSFVQIVRWNETIVAFFRLGEF